MAHVNKFRVSLSSPSPSDYPFYLDCCVSTPPSEHPIVPLFLRGVNVFLQNPQLTIFTAMGLGYFLTYFFSFMVTWQLTGKLYAGLIALSTALGFGYGFVYFLAATALKNLYALAFLLASLFLLLKLENKPRKTNMIIFLAFACLTALSHSLPIFMLLETLALYLLYAVYTKRAKPSWLLTVPALTMLAFATLAFTGKLSKFIDLGYNFVFNLPKTFMCNCIAAYIPYLAIFQVALITFLNSFVNKQKQNLFFASLLLNAGTLLFLGTKSLEHYSYSSRFHENVLPFLAIILGYVTNYVIEGVRTK